ncbi:MAG: DUF305 domain-containing protein [Actinomycetota bacterium]|nr:DUF305 domain-containing protein [Actinomycetota bacterium]
MKRGTSISPSAVPWLLAVVFGALAVTVLTLYLTSRSPADDSAEAGFARDMTVHHAQAVEMAEILRDKPVIPKMQTLATDIALTQQAQIGQMQGWLAVWRLPMTGTEPAMAWMGHPTSGLMPGMATPEEIEALREASPEEAERRFLQLMIPHHRAAVPMAEAVLQETDRPEVRRLASAIIASQKAEIEVMRELLAERGAKPDSHAHGGHHH